MMTSPTVELGPDDTVIVAGLSIDEVRALVASLAPRPPGRPPGPEITRDEIEAVIVSRRRWSDGPTQNELAADLGVSRTRLREAVGRNYGSWRQLLAITARRDGGDFTP